MISPLYYVIMVLMLAIGVVTVEKDGKIDTLKLENAQQIQKLTACADSLKLQNALILSNAQDENKIKALPKMLHDIQTRTVVVTKEIIKFKEDTNVSKNDCNASMRFIDDFDYSL